MNACFSPEKGTHGVDLALEVASLSGLHQERIWGRLLALRRTPGAAKYSGLFISPRESLPNNAMQRVGRTGPSESHHSGASG